MMKYILTIGSMLIGGSISQGEVLDPMINHAVSNVKLNKEEIRELRIRLDKGLPQSTPEDIIDYYNNTGDLSFLELLWWRSGEPNQRILIVALFRSTGEPGLSVGGDFEKMAARFNAQEAQLRIKEVAEGEKMAVLIRAKRDKLNK